MPLRWVNSVAGIVRHQRRVPNQVDTRSAFPGSSGSRAMLTAIRRTSSSVSIFACSASVALSSSSLTRSWLRWGVAPNKLLVDRPKRMNVRVNDARLRGKIWRVARHAGARSFIRWRRELTSSFFFQFGWLDTLLHQDDHPGSIRGRNMDLGGWLRSLGLEQYEARPSAKMQLTTRSCRT